MRTCRITLLLTREERELLDTVQGRTAGSQRSTIVQGLKLLLQTLDSALETEYAVPVGFAVREGAGQVEGS